MKTLLRWGLVALVLGLAGCATSPSLSVNVPRLSTDWPQGRVAVTAPSDASQWAVSQALGERQWQVDPSSAYRITVYETERDMVRSQDDPFCGAYGGYGFGPRYYRGYPGWYGPGPWGWGGGWGCAPPRLQSYTVREMTWVLTRQGDPRTLWSATARETSPRGPALELARKLAAGLALAPTVP